MNGLVILLSQLILLCLLYELLAAHVLIESVDHKLRPDVTYIKKTDQNLHHEVIFAIKQSNVNELERKLYDISSVDSPKYRQFMSFEEVGRFVENRDSTNAVLSWITTHRTLQVRSSTYGEYVYVKGPVSILENLLDTEFHDYEIDSGIVVRSMSYSLPDNMIPHIHAVFNTIDIPPRISKTLWRNLESSITLSSLSRYVVPSVLQELYDISTENNGYGSQAVFEALGQTFLPSDISKFLTAFGYPVDNVDKFVGTFPNNTICRYQSTSEDCVEATVDLQYIMSVGVGISTTYWYDSSNDGSFFTFFSNISDSAVIDNVYSISYSAYESDITNSKLSAVTTELIKLSLRGTTIVAATGDYGVTGFKFPSANYAISDCGYYAQWPASSPYVTAVGGTMNGYPITGTPEIVCSKASGSSITAGGGFSNSIAAPNFQKSAISNYFKQYSPKQSSTKAYSSSNRGYPDISLAANSYIAILNGKAILVDGTSLSTPVFAGMVALVNSYLLSRGGTSLGWINPTIYSTNGSFTIDVTQGNNSCTTTAGACCSIGFEAAVGWDPASGFGSVNFTKFLKYFADLNDDLTNFPTSIPTRAPTRTPTTTPSAIPTLPVPTTVPTQAPSRVPSRGPTPRPSVLPTTCPTNRPSRQPTMLPSPIPTVVSTTAIPTSNPTSVVALTIITFSLSQIFSSTISSSTFLGDSVAISGFVTIVKSILSPLTRTIYSCDVISASTASRRLLTSDITTTMITISYSLSFQTTNLNEVAALGTILQTNISSLLEDSISSNQFNTLLSSSSSTTLSSLSTNSTPTVSSAIYTYDYNQPSSSSSSGISENTIIIASSAGIAGLFLFCLFGCIVYHSIKRKRSGYHSRPPNTIEVRSVPIVEATVVRRNRGEHSDGDFHEAVPVSRVTESI